MNKNNDGNNDENENDTNVSNTQKQVCVVYLLHTIAQIYIIHLNI